MNASAPSMQILVAKIRALPMERIAEVEDFVDFLSVRANQPQPTAPTETLDFPVDHLGPWPIDLTLHREDLYGDDGR